jgi:hypothetical protein
VSHLLDPDALLAEARERTGLSDFGDPSLPERFRVAVAAMQEAGMDEDGRRIAAGVCVEQLTQRLEFFEDRRSHPIPEEIIERPIFATGEPRSGTTLLHVLLSLDPKARSLRFWELMYPSPPPGLAPLDDPRRARADEEWRAILRRIPKWLVNHPYNDMLGDGLAEDERAWGFDFRVLGPTVWWRVPMPMVMSGLPSDPLAQYRLHRMVLQHLQFARPRRHWALKGFHSGKLPELFEVYPDAEVIWTHRDPVQVIASRIVMAGELDEGLYGAVDWSATASRYLALSRASIRAALNSPHLDDSRVHHVRFRDFAADPVATISDFYDQIGRSVSSTYAEEMRAYLRDNPSDRHGKFTYSLDIIGEDVDALNDEFAEYRERFGLEVEARR